MFSLTLSHAPLMSPLSSVTWYCSLTSPFFNLLLLKLGIYFLCSSLTHCQSLPHFCYYQLAVSITVSPSDVSDIKCTWVLSSIYQNVINLVGCLYLGRGPGVFEKFMAQEQCQTTLFESVSVCEQSVSSKQINQWRGKKKSKSLVHGT
jgi:hypothetical protein